MKMKHLMVLTCAGMLGAAPMLVFAHGFAGKRFFPATLASDDPFVADELSLPLVSQRKLAGSAESPATTQTSTSVDFTKRITPNLGIGFGASHLRLRDEEGSVRKG